jgi:DsbC/DsbD-like thiol-disulfide interchange protein
MFRIRSFMLGAGVAVLLVTAFGERAAAQRGSLTGTLSGRRTAPGSDTLALRIALRMTPGWHIGAARPGVTGVPTELAWRLPAGWRVVATRWPPPASAMVGRDTVFEYRGPFAIEATVVTDRRRRSGPIQALVTYGICKDMCIPGRLTLKYDAR